MNVKLYREHENNFLMLNINNQYWIKIEMLKKILFSIRKDLFRAKPHMENSPIKFSNLQNHLFEPRPSISKL